MNNLTKLLNEAMSLHRDGKLCGTDDLYKSLVGSIIAFLPWIVTELPTPKFSTVENGSNKDQPFNHNTIFGDLA